MRRILVSIFFFLLLLIIADRVFYYFFNKYIFEKTITGEEGAGNVNYFLQNGYKYTGVILGSSRAKRQINPKLLTAIPRRVYNEGVNGLGGVKYMNVMIDLLFAHHIYPKYILLQTDATWLTQQDDFPEEEIRLFFPFIHQSKVLDAYVAQLPYREKLKLFLLKSYRFNGRFLNIIFNYRKRKNIGSYKDFTGINNEMDSATANNYLIKRQQDLNKVFVPEMLAALKNTINSCKAHNVRLFIVLPPFFNNTKYSAELLKNFLFIYQDADIIDMSDIRKFPDLQDRKNWLDYSHLNITGANKFSSYLNDSLSARLQKSVYPN